MSVSDELGRLGDLHQRGLLSDEEFARAKARVLDGAPSGTYTGMGTPRPAAPREPVGRFEINALRRSTSDRWLGGVCGGIAQVTGLASWIWRLIFTLSMIFAGSGLLLYVLLWIFVPTEMLYLPAPDDRLSPR